MINQINLSSRPFRNRTLPWILSATVLAVSLIGCFFVYVEWQKASNQAKALKAETAQIEPKINALKSDNDKIRQQLTPAERTLLSSTHTLVDRKRFSWSRLFSDLESVLPREVSVSHIGVRDVYQSEGRMLAELDFAVLSRNYQSVANMLGEMNSSGMFQSVELRAQDLQRDKGNMTEYTMQLRYSPRSGQNIAPEDETGSDETTSTTAQNGRTLAEVNTQ